MMYLYNIIKGENKMFTQKPDPIMVNIDEFNNLNGGEKLISEIEIN